MTLLAPLNDLQLCTFLALWWGGDASVPYHTPQPAPFLLTPAWRTPPRHCGYTAVAILTNATGWRMPLPLSHHLPLVACAVARTHATHHPTPHTPTLPLPPAIPRTHALPHCPFTFAWPTPLPGQVPIYVRPHTPPTHYPTRIPHITPTHTLVSPHHTPPHLGYLPLPHPTPYLLGCPAFALGTQYILFTRARVFQRCDTFSLPKPPLVGDIRVTWRTIASPRAPLLSAWCFVHWSV